MATRAFEPRPTIGDRIFSVLGGLLPSRVEMDNVEGLVRTYAGALYVIARGLSAADGDALDRLATRLRDELSQPSPDLREVFAIEIQLSRLMPDDIRQRRYWEYRARFQRVASPKELASYLASNPPPPAETGDSATPARAVCEADNVVLLTHIHRNYLLTVLREQAERDLKWWIQRALLKGMGFYGSLLALLIGAHLYQLIPSPVLYFAIGITLLYLVGRLGAATSIIQRLQKAVREPTRDPFFEITALCTGRRGISIAMMEGGIFALLLYVLFSAGLGQNLGMSGGIFPKVEAYSPADRSSNGAEAQASESATAEKLGKKDRALSARGAASTAQAPREGRPAARTHHDECDTASVICMPSFISEIGKHLGFQNYPDFFKMLLLAFLAGFAERLVPDAIDRLIQRRAENGDKVARTVKAGT